MKQLTTLVRSYTLGPQEMAEALGCEGTVVKVEIAPADSFLPYKIHIQTSVIVEEEEK